MAKSASIGNRILTLNERDEFMSASSRYSTLATPLLMVLVSLAFLFSLSACSMTPSGEGTMGKWWQNQRWANASDDSEADM